MKGFFYVSALLAIMALAFWAYRENYATKAALDDLARIDRAITDERAALAILRAEWAYLNRPDRLRDLASLNFDRLGLLPMLPEQFGRVDQVAFPLPPEPILLEGLTDTAAQTGPGEITP
jgi:hypothetical protein